MIRFDVPGLGDFQLAHLIMDVNGTLALDGLLIDGVAPKLSYLAGLVKIHLLTADTYGKQYLIDQQLGLTAVRLQPGNEALQKGDYVRKLGGETVAAIGQGANDVEMLKAAKLGICVLSIEGVARDTFLACDLVATTILSALELLEKPARIKASLRR
jgi:P-type E1-E2 ATPase